MEITKLIFGKSVKLNYKGKEVKLHVFSMKKGQVKFGIEAPEGFSIHREEIYQLINENTEQS